MSCRWGGCSPRELSRARISLVIWLKWGARRRHPCFSGPEKQQYSTRILVCWGVDEGTINDDMPIDENGGGGNNNNNNSAANNCQNDEGEGRRDRISEAEGTNSPGAQQHDHVPSLLNRLPSRQRQTCYGGESEKLHLMLMEYMNDLFVKPHDHETYQQRVEQNVKKLTSRKWLKS